VTARQSERALVVAPRGRDAAIASAMLREAGIEAEACSSLPLLIGSFEDGVGLVILTEEVLASADIAPLAAWLAGQEEWSDLPFILLTTRGGGLERNPSAARYLELLGNVTFLERPFHPTTLISLARAGLRGRRRQYDARTRLEELRSSAERYRTLFDSIDAGFCIIEVIFRDERPVDYRFCEVNPAFVRQTGLKNAVGRRVREMAPDLEQHWFDTYGAVARTGEPTRFENRADELGRWYDVYAFRVGDPAAYRVAVLFNDITARRSMELELRELTASLERRVKDATTEREVALAQLHEAQKLETLGQLTGGVAHDFNNLLTPITGVLDLMHRRYGKQDERDARLIGGALESAERARVLVQRLLGFARRQALQTQPVDLATLLDGMRDLIASSVGATIEVSLRIDGSLPAALADPNQLELAILNLCVNARDAMPTGGVLTVAAEPVALGPGEVAEVKPGLYVRLSVIDTGVGMDEATLSRAVEPFYSTKEVGKGTGLGLSMVHGLASQLGGGFRITSAVGEGTRIDLWLPIASERAADRRPAYDAPVATARSLAILLVDDEQLVRAATAAMLRELGHDVAEASSGADALVKLPTRAFDLVVTDYKMPRMDGAELARRVREARPELPLLLITGYTGASDEALDLPRLDKPFRRAELAAAIERTLYSRRNVVPLRRD
jgi:signal transduction histidine kinase/DNA-binding response OmpR family regulator